MNYLRTAILLAGLTALFMAVGYLIGGGTGMMIALVIAAATNLFSYWNSDKLVLSMHQAQEVDEQSAPEFVGIVRELAQRADLPMPRVYLMDSAQPNAFATGRNPQHAAVCATTGLLNTLNRDEVAGVIGHELGHVRNHDTLTMTITATIAGAISMLAQLGMFFGRRRDNNSGLGIVGSLLMLVLAPLAAMIVQMAISRTREYAADNLGARISGRPDALASALVKISKLDQLMEHFRRVRDHRPSSLPMQKIIAFALFSTRRQEEITLLRWDDLDDDRILVRDMKHPGDKKGNNVYCELPSEALAIIKSMPRVEPEIFPYSTDAVSAAFTRACKILGIADLRFHDLRHEGISRLFEMGRTIPQAAAVSGHRSWTSLKRYTHLRQSKDKYESWNWKALISA